MASAATNSGSFFSSPLWKRVFSRRSTSPSFIAATAASAFGPTQSSAKATGRPSTADSAGTTCFSEKAGSGPPFGRPKWASRMTLPPLSGDLGDGRRDGADAGVVGDLAVGHRDVEVDADEHALALHVGLVERAECGHGVMYPQL